MLTINNFNITITPIRNFRYECIIVNKEGGSTYGIIVQSHTPPTPEGIYNVFITQPKNFFIEAEVISKEIQQVVGVVVDSPIPSGSNEPQQPLDNQQSV